MESSDPCRYTYDEIVKSKTLTLDEIQKDFMKLNKFTADTNPRKWCGNAILYHYQFANLLECRRDTKGYKTLKEIFDDRELKKKVWEQTVQRNRRKKGIEFILPIDIYEAYRINTGAIVFFKPSTAKYIYKWFGAKNVLDPTAGWGGRMLGAMSLGINYTGIDTNTNLKEGYENMLKDIPHEGNMKMIWENCLDVDYSKIKYDLVLTSPPYINMEIYENMKLFDKDAFYTDFLMPLMYKVYEHLEDGGHMCINISPKMFKDLIKSGFCEPNFKIDLRQQLGQQYKTKSQDYVYIWEK